MRAGRDAEGAQGHESTAVRTLRCDECNAESSPEARHWRAYRVDLLLEDGSALVFFCPGCVEREFGER
jgi:hypothetical protein